MNLRLHERRTSTRLIDGLTACEDNCIYCGADGSVSQMESLKPNIHEQNDNRGNIMMEQRVTCLRCGAEWVDVFCRMYPPCTDLPDTKDDEERHCH